MHLDLSPVRRQPMSPAEAARLQGLSIHQVEWAEALQEDMRAGIRRAVEQGVLILDASPAALESMFHCPLSEADLTFFKGFANEISAKTMWADAKGLRSRTFSLDHLKPRELRVSIPHDFVHWAVARFLRLEDEPTFLCGPDVEDHELRVLREQLDPRVAVYCHSQTMYEEMFVTLWGAQSVEGEPYSLLRLCMDRGKVLSLKETLSPRDGFSQQVVDLMEDYNPDLFWDVFYLFKHLSLFYTRNTLIQYMASRDELKPQTWRALRFFDDNAEMLIQHFPKSLHDLAQQIYRVYRDHQEGDEPPRILLDIFHDMLSGKLVAPEDEPGVRCQNPPFRGIEIRPDGTHIVHAPGGWLY